MTRVLSITFVLLLLVGCTSKEGSLFKSVDQKKSSLNFTNKVISTNDLNILDYLYFYNGGGVAIGDINNDGLPDVYLTANQEKNKLFLNKGNLQFEDITETAGVSGKSDWNTGVVMVDINGDGLLDIYSCAVVGINGFDGHNELYINNGDNTFTEQSRAYGLDFDTYSSSATFFDYDLDGDLDIYLLNHAVHTPESFGKVEIRNQRNYETGDRLLRNDNGKFVDVSEEAGIYGGINGYGLGVAVADFNKDGYPDLYIGNDFHEDDYYYLNQGDGTFKESLKEYFGHITRFSMGSDVADINNDGWPDLMSLDMLPEDEKVLKSSEGDDNFQTLKLRTENYGYHYQFTRNMLFVNQQNSPYLETALHSGVGATDWSWSVLMEDYNQDGHQDMFISNGIPKRPNNLDFIKFVSSQKIKKKITETKLVDNEAFNLMPSGKANNYLFEGTEGLKFKNQSTTWKSVDSLVSGATAFGDLDNDGDLDIIINNLNSPVTLLENKTNNSSNYLKLKLKYKGENPNGIGAKVYSYHQGKVQSKELYTVRGFQASSEPIIHFGYGKNTAIDSLKVVWPDNTSQILSDIKSNQTLEIAYQTTTRNVINKKTQQLFTKIEGNLGIDFTHKEDRYIDFHRQLLIPYRTSDLGPAVAIGDLNGDGKEDIFFGGSKNTPSTIYTQNGDRFKRIALPSIQNDSLKEDVSAFISDLNNDGKNDLFVGSGGADFGGKQPALLDDVYFSNGEEFSKKTIDKLFENAAVVVENDMDNDGDLDIFVGNHVVTNRYGEAANSYILKNEKGNFTATPIQLKNPGLITDAIWEDFDGDQQKDLIIVGEWMSPVFLKNNNGSFTETDVLQSSINGLWQKVIAFDIDNDGDQDYLLANWGTNSKFFASKTQPMKLYFNDFDGNGIKEPVITKSVNNNYYTVANFDELSTQMPNLRKKFNSYDAFAGKTIDQIFDKKDLDNSLQLKVEVLESGYLENNNGTFTFVPFKEELQLSPLKAFVKADFNKDGKEEVLVAGNYFGVAPYHSRFDSFPGALIKSNTAITLGNKLGLEFSLKSARHLNTFTIKNKQYLLVTYNNDKAQIYEF